jgi:hypothetical protein
MSSRNLSDEEFLEKLRAHPELRGRMGGLLLAVEDEQGDLRTADAMEMKLIEELRQMGRESLSAWASSQVKKATAEERQAGRVWQEGKKNCAGTPRLEKSA